MSVFQLLSANEKVSLMESERAWCSGFSLSFHKEMTIDHSEKVRERKKEESTQFSDLVGHVQPEMVKHYHVAPCEELQSVKWKSALSLLSCDWQHVLKIYTSKAWLEILCSLTIKKRVKKMGAEKSDSEQGFTNLLYLLNHWPKLVDLNWFFFRTQTRQHVKHRLHRKLTIL